jgi:hypothetical protein
MLLLTALRKNAAARRELSHLSESLLVEVAGARPAREPVGAFCRASPRDRLSVQGWAR